MNGGSKTSALKSSRDPRFIFARIGWEEARLGLPFNQKLVDAGAFHESSAYEQMRLCVLALRSKGEAVPEWKNKKLMPEPIATAFSIGKILNRKAREEEQNCFWPVGEKGWQKKESQIP